MSYFGAAGPFLVNAPGAPSVQNFSQQGPFQQQQPVVFQQPSIFQQSPQQLRQEPQQQEQFGIYYEREDITYEEEEEEEGEEESFEDVHKRMKRLSMPKKVKDVFKTSLRVAADFSLGDINNRDPQTKTSQGAPGKFSFDEYMPIKIKITKDNLQKIFKPNLLTDIDKLVRNPGVVYDNLNRIMIVKLTLRETSIKCPIGIAIKCENPKADNWNAEFLCQYHNGEVSYGQAMINTGRGTITTDEPRIIFDHKDFLNSNLFQLYGCMDKGEIERSYQKREREWMVKEGTPLHDRLMRCIAEKYPQWDIKETNISGTKYLSFPADIAASNLAYIIDNHPKLGIMDLSNGLEFSIRATTNASDLYNKGATVETKCSVSFLLEIEYVYPRTKHEEEKALKEKKKKEEKEKSESESEESSEEEKTEKKKGKKTKK